MKQGALALLFVVTALYLHSYTPPMIYPDTRDYRQISRLTVGDVHFWHAVRPPVVPLFLKLSENNDTISWLQLLFYVAASLALAWAAARWMQRRKTLAFGVALAWALVPQQFVWCRSIASESLTFSLLYLHLFWTTLLARPPERRLWQIVAWCGWVITTALLIFARDANSYLLIFLWIFIAALLYRRVWVRIAVPVILLFAIICSSQATAGGRWKWPFVNILGQRVLWRPDRTAFFVERGMPVNPKVMCFAGRWGWDCHDDLSGFGTWLDGNIRGMYGSYLASHPIESSVTPFLHLDKTLLAADGPKGMFYYFHQQPAWYHWFGRIWFQSPVTLLLLMMGFAAAAWRARRALLPSLPLLASVGPMLFFLWHADAHEPMRHAVVPAALFRLGLLFGILLAYDWMSLAWRASAHDGNTSL
jgi:hypothetical protein